MPESKTFSRLTPNSKSRPSFFFPDKVTENAFCLYANSLSHNPPHRPGPHGAILGHHCDMTG